MKIARNSRNLTELASGVLIIITLILVLFSGCASFKRLVNENEFTMQLATEAATARVLHDRPLWVWQTITITNNAMAMIDAKQFVELGDVETYVKSRMHWDTMMPEEQALVSVLISQVRRNIEDTLRARAKNITDTGTQLVEVRKVLEWINAVAKRRATIGGRS